MVTGAVPVINLPVLVGAHLTLDGPTLADIFSGNIDRWDAPAIAALNPTLSLPSTRINVIARSDGSGTTHNVTDYLSKTSTPWKERFGAGSRIDWAPSIMTAKGSSGVVATLQATPGSITYVDFSYVLKHALNGVKMINRAGRPVSASLASFRSALMNSAWQSAGDFKQALTNMPGADSWPITLGTYVLIPRRIEDRDAGRALVSFFSWAFMNGDALATEANFVRLPDPVQAKAYRALASIVDTQGRVLVFDALTH